MRLMLLLLLLLSSTAGADPDALVKWLTPKLEEHLRQSTGQRELGLTLAAKREGSQVVLSIPDYIARATMFQVQLQPEGSVVHLRGRVLDAEQKQLVEEAVQSTWKRPVRSHIEVFPFGQAQPYAIFTAPRSNLGASADQPAQGKNLATQARLGELAWRLESRGEWERVRLDTDGYIAWARRSDLKPLSAAEFQRWRQSPQALLQTDVPLCSIFLGTRLPLRQDAGRGVQLEEPDGKLLTVPAQAVEPRPSTAEAVLALAREFLPGGPNAVTTYLWGGSVGRELDCSGYVQTVFRACGRELPRDADQQMAYCPPVASQAELQPADLIFFSEKREYADHIGIYLGDGQFIHCSSGGDKPGVKISTLQGGTDYDKALQKMYYGAGRVPLQ